MFCIFSSYHFISNFILLSFLLLLLLDASPEQSEAFAKLMKVEAFMPREMGSMGTVPSLSSGCIVVEVADWIQDRMQPLSSCRSGTSTWMQSTLMKAGVKSVSWMKGGAPRGTKVFGFPIEKIIFQALKWDGILETGQWRLWGVVFQKKIHVHSDQTSWDLTFSNLFWEKCFLVWVNQDYIWMTGLVAVTTKSQQSVKPRRKAFGGKWL